MKHFLAYVTFSFIPVLAVAQGTATFESRVDSARAVEGQQAAREYLEQRLFPAMRADLSSATQRCLASRGASKAGFTIVADVVSDGSVANVAVKPATDTSNCFANALRALRLPPPPGIYSPSLPIVLDMEFGG
jgi:hypothetical protein